MQPVERDPKTYRLIGAAMEVHRRLGSGFLEGVYQEAFEIELKSLGIPYARESEVFIRYGGQVLQSKYRPDFIAFDEIIIEFKTVQCLLDPHIRQVVHYLKATGFRLGLLVNFASEKLEWRRLIHTPDFRHP